MKKSTTGFTIVELLIVVVVIAILAAITIVSYNGITATAKESSLKTDLSTSAKLLENKKTLNGSYPANQTVAALQPSEGNTLTYTKSTEPGADDYCVSGVNGVFRYFISSRNSTIQGGSCPGWFWVTRGAAGPTGGTYYAMVTTSGFAAGTYRLRCYQNGASFSSFANYNLPANGMLQLNCYTDGSYGKVAVEIENIGISNAVSW